MITSCQDTLQRESPEIKSVLEGHLGAESSLTAHFHVGLIFCDDVAMLEEILTQLDLDALHIERLGAAALVGPSEEIELMLNRFHEHGVFPKVFFPAAGEAA